MNDQGEDEVVVNVRFDDDLDAIAGLWLAAGERILELRRDGRRLGRAGAAPRPQSEAG